MRISAKPIIEAMDSRPQAWSVGRHYVEDKQTGVKVWTANGFAFLGLYEPFEAKFSFIDKLRIHSRLPILGQISLKRAMSKKPSR